MPDSVPLSKPSVPRKAEAPAPSIPRIAVSIAARNAQAHLADALESIALQTEPADEVVVFDDGSTDETRSVAEGFRSRIPSLKILSRPASGGISSARNRANEAVTSDFIAVLDADDLLDSRALENYRKFLAAHPETDLVYGDTKVFSSQPDAGKLLRYPRFSNPRAGIRSTLAAPRVPMKHSSMLYRKSTMDRLGGYDETFRIKVDIELFLRFLQRGCEVKKLDVSTSFHRKHHGQISTRRLEGIRAYSVLTNRYEPSILLRPVLLASRTLGELAKLLLRG